METERLSLFSLLTTDPFLKDYVEPVLFDKLPPPTRPAGKPYLDVLKKCQIYVLMLDREYASEGIGASPTHEEYDLARSMGIPALAMVKGSHDSGRDRRTQAFLTQIKSDRFTYKRFVDRIDLKQEVAAWLRQVLKEEHGLIPTPEADESSGDTIEATSGFEATQQDNVTVDDLDQGMCRVLSKAMIGKIAGTRMDMLKFFHTRGLLWRDDESGALLPTAAGVVFLGKNPAMKYLQCQVLADAYADTKVTSKPRAQAKLSGPVPQMIERLIAFVHAETEHPTRVVGVNNIELDEYPQKAVREALVNAFAHRDYADTARKLRVEIFRDRLVVSSPGYPPKPLTLAKLRQGRYESCRRNPVLAECLASLNMMEQRGTGFERIRAAMLDHGLDLHQLDQQDGYFKVILPGPNGDYDRLRVPTDARGFVPPSVEASLNKRQKQIMLQAQTQGSVSTAWVIERLHVARDTSRRDFDLLMKLGLVDREGRGRSVRYVPACRMAESTDNRPTDREK